MASGAPDRRSDPRVLLQVPIEMRGGSGQVRAHTVVVSRQGAMVLSPQRFREEDLVRIQNLENAEKTLCRVVWCGGEDLPGLFKLGLELLGRAPGFWGEPYETAAREIPKRDLPVAGGYSK